MFCRSCGSEIDDKAVICVKCGSKPFSGKAYCIRCGSKVNDEMELCPSCGIRLRPKPINYKKKAKIAKGISLYGFVLTVLLFTVLFIRSSNSPEYIRDKAYVLYEDEEYFYVQNRNLVPEEVQSYWAENIRLGLLLVMSIITTVISSIVAISQSIKSKRQSKRRN